MTTNPEQPTTPTTPKRTYTAMVDGVLTECSAEPDKGINDGRPTKLTPELIKDIVKWIRAGNYIEIAAQKAGVSKVIYYNWLHRGETEKDTIYEEFFNCIKEAEAACETASLLKVQTATKDAPWQNIAWFLERRFRSRWGRQVTISGDPDAPLQINVTHDLSEFTIDELRAYEALTRKALDTAKRKLLESGTDSNAVDAEYKDIEEPKL